MNTLVIQLMVAAIGIFSLALMIIQVRSRHAGHPQPRRAPPRSAQAGAVLESLFRSRS